MRKSAFPYILITLFFLAVTAGTGWGQTVTLISPNTTGLTWSGVEEIEWSTSGFNPGDTVYLELSSDGGVAYDTLFAQNLPYDLETFRFYTTTLADGTSYRVRITRTGGGASDESGSNFEISNPIPIPGTAFYVNDASTTNDVYCTAAGSDANDGLSPATPRLTLQTVVADYALGEGDVVYIDTGEWIRVTTELTVTSTDKGSALSPLYFTGSPNGTIFSGNFQPGSARRIIINGSSYLSFSNLSLESSLQEAVYIIDSNNVEIVGSSINNNSWGVRTSRTGSVSLIDNLIETNRAGAILLSAGSHHLVDGNIVTGNTSEGSYTVFLDSVSFSRIINNTIQNNSGSGILNTRGNYNSIQYNLISNSASRNLMIDRSSYTDASHNLLLNPGSYNLFIDRTSRTSVFNNFLYGSGFYIGAQDENLSVVNNIIWSFQANTYCIYGRWESAEEQGIVSDFNLLFPTGGALAGYWEGNRTDLRSWILGSGQDGRSISENPLLVDFSGGDYHLQSTEGSYHDGAWTNDSNDSPALNAGIVVTAETTLASPLSKGGTSVSLVSAADFLPGPGQVQIDDDIISYAGIAGNILTGCSGILEVHPAGAGVFQPVGSAYNREPAANGGRVNIGPYGNTVQASKSSRRSLMITSPLGGPLGYEKWAREKNIDWLTIGSGWGALDTIAISYSSDSVDWATITEGIAYDSQPYANWNTLSVAESNTGRIRIIPSAGATNAASGIFIVDNTPPTIGLFSPEDGATGIPVNTALISDIPTDAGAGLHPTSPYYFRIDRAESFDSPDLQTSGWLPTRTWYVDLDPGTGYYWQVRSRDAADPSNISDFFAETNIPGSYWKLRTSLVLQADDIESATTGLRWMLDNYDLGPGDTIYVTPGTYLLTAPLSFTAGDQGDEGAGVRIEGLNGEVILDGGGLAANCLTVTGDYFEIENFSGTNAVGSGILLTGNHNILQGGKAFLNGGDGVEIRGDYNMVRNILAYANLRAGFRLVAAYRNQLENNTSAGNGSREIFLEDSGLYDGSIETRLTNNIISASGTGKTALYVESSSRTGLDSDYNLLYATGGAKIGYWGGSELATFSQWTETSFQDQSSLSSNPLFVGGGNYRLQSTMGSFKPGIGWTADGSNSPGLDRGDPLSIAYLEPAPGGSGINMGAYGNTLQASLSPGGTGRNFYINDSSTYLDYFCTQPGKTWAQGHTGLSPSDPLEAIDSVFSHHSIQAGDTIYVDTGSYQISSPIIPPVSGSGGNNVTFAGSPRGTILDGQGVSPYCFLLENKDYISIGGFDLANPTANVLFAFTVHHLRFSRNRVVGAVEDGINFERAYDAVFIENRVEHNVGSGIQGVNADNSFTGRGNRISSNFGTGIEIYRGGNVELSENTVESSGGTGIDLTSIQGLIIEDNVLTDNGPVDDGRTAGIYVAGSGSETVLRGNTVSGSRYGIDNRFVGAEISGNRIFSNVYGLYLASNNCLVRNNIIHDNQDWGIYQYGGNDTTINNNVIYENGLYELFIRSGVSRSIIRNNIISPRGSGNFGIYAQDSNPATRDYLIDYNIFSAAGGARVGYWQGNRDTFWNWQTQTRQDGHSLAGDPLFENPGAGIFYLQSTLGRFSEGKWYFNGVDSPGLNRGDPDDDYADELAPNGSRVNIGAFGDTPEASRSSISSLAVISPVGTAAGEEKWSGEHALRWEQIGDDWEIGDLFRIDYSTDGSVFTLITDGIPWPGNTYSDWDTRGYPDGRTYQIRVSQTAGGAAQAQSGLFILDNTPPANVGCQLPPAGASRESLSGSLLAREASDNPAGLALEAYYFQIDTTPSFDSGNQQDSGWRESRSWNPELDPNTFYYWRVKARDSSDPPNESVFCGFTADTEGFGSFKTIGVYHALDIESPTDGLRWILANEELAPGDIVYVESGDYPLATPLELSSADEGDSDDPVRIIGVGGEVLLNGSGVENCLVISGDYFRVENFSFTNANGSGVLISGDHDTVQGGRSFSNGGDGIEVRGDYTTIRNMLVYANGEAGIHLFTSHHSTLKNNTCSGNGTREIFLEDEPVNALHPERPVGSTYALLRNNIIDAAGPGKFAIFLDEFSQTEFNSDYNLFHTAGGAAAGYWNSATQTTFSDWTGSSGEDFNSISGDPLYVGGGNYRLQSTRGSYKGGTWSADTNNSPGLDRGDPADISFYESAPHGDRVNLGSYGNTVEASWAIGSTFGTNYYVNDSSTEWDYYCTTGGLPWPEHDGLSPGSPLDSIEAVISAYSLWPGDTIYVDTGLYFLEGALTFPRSGEADNPVTVTGSPRGTILDGAGIIASCFNLTYARYITLANLTLINAREYGIYADTADYLQLAQTGARGANIDGFFIYRSKAIRLDGCTNSYHGRHGFYIPLLNDQTAALSDCRAENNAGNGLYIFRGINSTITDSISRNNAEIGFALEGLYGTTTIADNQALDNLNRGFSVEASSYSTTTLLDGNLAQGNGEEGIYVASPNDSRITGNRSTGNTKQGFRFYASQNAKILDNVSYLNQDFGFQIERSRGSFLLNNTGYKNGGEIKLVSDISNIDLTIRNNSLWASGTGNYALRFAVGDPATLEWKSNYNCLYVTDGAYTGWLSGPGAAGRDFPTLFDWHITSGLDGDSIDYDPVFVDPENGDFHLQSPLGSYHNGYWTTDLNSSPALNQGQIYLATSFLTADIFPASPYIDLDDGTDFTATTDRVEINGNIIGYSGKTGNRLTGVGGISTTHGAGSLVFQPVGSDYTREPGPNGERIDIGAAGGTEKASLALIKTLPILRPLGGEQWSGTQIIRWLAIPGDEWTDGEPIDIEYSTDGFNTSHPLASWHYETTQPQEYAWDTLSAGGDSDLYQIRLAGGGLTTTSGIFTVDNTPPTGVGCLFPEDQDVRLPTYIPLRGLEPIDNLVGLNAEPYYFQLDTSPLFGSPDLQNSGWLSRNAWRPNLTGGTTYYWRVKTRDAVDLPNESAFCGFSIDTDGWGTFSTANIFRATDIESQTTGLRWILDNRDISPGDTIMIESGFHSMSEPVTVMIADGGSRYSPVRIAGVGTGAVLDGGAAVGNCLILAADYVVLENISFTDATGSGLLVTGSNNIVREGASYLNGGPGVEISGAANQLSNFLAYGNQGPGVRLFGAEGNRVVNVTSHGNQSGEVICDDAPYTYLRNNILWAAATGYHSLNVDAVSETGFASDHNNLYATDAAFVGYWGSDQTDLGNWQGASFQDQSSLSLDPLFADAAGGDYHLKSPGGRWAGWISWTTVDIQTSPSIDAGDPSFPYFRETSPKGGRINQGAFGNSFQGSRSNGQPGTNYFLNDDSLTDNLFTIAAGNDSNNGRTPATPKRTLDGMGGILSIDLEPGDTVFIDTGEYSLSGEALIYGLHSGTSVNPVSFVGSPNISLIDGDFIPGAGIVFAAAEYNILDRIHSVGSLGIPAIPGSGYGVRGSGSRSITIRESNISWHGQALGEGGGGVRFTNSTDLVLENNLIGFTTSAGIHLEGTAELSLTGNRIWTNLGAGVFAEWATGLLVSNTIIYNNRGAGITLADSANGEIRENTIYSNLNRGIVIDGEQLEINRNLVYDNNLGSGVITSKAGIFADGIDLIISNNTLYRNRGVEFRGESTGLAFLNNIAWAEGTNTHALWFQRATDQFSDFNLLTAIGGAATGQWTTGTAYSLNDWQLRSRLDPHSFGSDPLFVNPAGPDGIIGGVGGEDDDFHPRSTEGSFHFGLWINDVSDSPTLNTGNPDNTYYFETDPNGYRINIGAYGNTPQASRSNLDTIFLISPYGGSFGEEKWSGSHDLTWSAHGPGWGPGRTVDLEYTTNGADFLIIAAGAAWDLQTYSTWNTSTLSDGIYYQVMVSDSSDPTISSISGRFMVDNSPPTNVGLLSPANNYLYVDPEDANLEARGAIDALAGLNPLPYYFRVDTSPTFNSGNLVTSGWVASRQWNTQSLAADTWYYWQVQAQDGADLPNQSVFCGFATDTEGYGTFKTVRVYHVTTVEGADELRDVLDNKIIEEGDIIRLRASGDFGVAGSGVIVPSSLTGTATLPIRIEGYEGRPVVYGDGLVDFLLDVQSYYTRVQGIDFTGSGNAGLRISGDFNTVNRCRSYEQGGAGVEVTGDHNLVKNSMSYLNGAEGILLDGGTANRVYNNSLYGNETAGLGLASSADSNLRNNVSWAVGVGSFAVSVDNTSETGLVCDYNDLYTTDSGSIGYWDNQTRATFAAWQGASGHDAASINADPKFYQVALWGNREYIYDLHLRSPALDGPSPCANVGVSLAGAVDDDYDGENRPFGAAYDIGADEWVNTNPGNNLPDYWELQYFGDLDPDRTDSDDPDVDFLTNIREYRFYTDPTDPDTDGDLLTDGNEVDIYSTNPLDPDSDWDGLEDGDEITQGTDPDDPDSDGDGLLDGFSVDATTISAERIAYFESQGIVRVGDWFMGELSVGTDPLDPDSDDDGCPDGWEVFYGLNPLDNGAADINDGGIGDPDGDRLNNYEEYLFGTSPIDASDPVTRYVDAAAAGGDGSSWANAWNSIEDALDWKADTGVPAIVLVTGGVYYESGLELDEDHSGLALMGSHPYQRPALDAGQAGRAFSVFNVQTAKIDSFEIRNARFSGSGAAFYLFGSSPILSNLLIHNNTASGVGRGGAVFVTGSAARPLIIGNSIAKNTGYSNYGGIYVAAGAPRYADNILWHNGVDLYQFGLTTETIRYCNIGTQEGGLNIIGFAGNISVEPGFRHLGADRFHLATFFGQSNPNINSGTSAESLTGGYAPAMLQDYEGEARWNYLSQPVTGGGITGLYYYDIGADEYVDTDYNTLPDWWEIEYWAAIGQNPALDPDVDNLTNYLDYYYLTNPLKYDTAVSGMSDGEEVTYWNSTHGIDWPDSPAGPQRWDSDADSDGTINILDADSDEDKLIDGHRLQRTAMSAEDIALLESLNIVEVGGWFMGERYVGTDPADPDTDGDLFDDGDEVYYWVYTHNQLFPDGAETSWDTDWDGDGVPNILDPDGDGDLTPDGWEYLYDLDPNDDGYYFLENGAGGDPDDDRLNNYIEYLFETNPRNVDDPDYVIVDINGSIGIDCDYNYIKDAIASETGPIRIIVRPGVYPETEISPKERMALLGEYAYNTIIDAAGGRGVIFSGVEAALLDGFTIRNAEYEGPGAAILCYSASPFISNSVISFNTSTGADGYGAALYAMESSYPILVNNTIASNRGSDGIGGVALDSPDDNIFLINNILWDNQTDLFGTQTDMVHYSNLESGLYDGVNFNLSVDPLFTNAPAGNFHIYYLSDMVCAGGYPLAGGYDMDGTWRPQTSCPSVSIIQNSFNIGAHEAKYEPSPSPSVTPTPTPSITPTPTVTPTISPTPPEPSPPPTPENTPDFPSPTPRVPTPPPTATPEPPLPPTPPTTPVLPTRTPTPVPTATPEFTPTLTPFGYKTPTPSPTPVDFYYRDPAQNSFLSLYIDDYDTYYSIGWAGDDWRDIYGLPPNRWYAARWSYGTYPGQTQWSEWTYHETETQWLEPDWPTPTPTPEGYRTPTPVPDFYYRDPARNSFLSLYIDDYDTYYSIGWSGDDWQAILNMPDYRWYAARWTYGPQPSQTWWSEWTYHGTATQWLEPDWPPRTPTATPTATLTPPPTPSPTIGITPTPSVTPSVTPTPTPSYAFWYSAAGATEIDGMPFDTFLAVNNPTNADAYVEFQAIDEQGLIIRRNDIISPESRYTLDVNEMVKGTRGERNRSISLTVFDLTDRIIMVDRSMYWNPGGVQWGGGHNSIVSNTIAPHWYLPEGATHIFDEYIHILNPDPDFPAEVQVTFMNKFGDTFVTQTTVNPLSNWVVYANEVAGSQDQLATRVDSLPQDDPAIRAEWPPDGRAPIAADRTMYWDTDYWNEGPNVKWIDGHSSRGITEVSTLWYLAEGATHLFDEYIQVINPSLTEEAEIEITLMDRNGIILERVKTVGPHSRYTMKVNDYVGSQEHVSAIIRSLNGQFIMCERAMYWTAGGIVWAGGHNTVGTPFGAPVWYLPEGATDIFDEYILLANPNPLDSDARVTFYFEDAPPQQIFTRIKADSRQTIKVNNVTGITNAISARIEDTTEPFSAKLPLIAERAMYWNTPPIPSGIHWGSGHATIGIPVRTEGK